MRRTIDMDGRMARTYLYVLKHQAEVSVYRAVDHVYPITYKFFDSPKDSDILGDKDDIKAYLEEVGVEWNPNDK